MNVEGGRGFVRNNIVTVAYWLAFVPEWLQILELVLREALSTPRDPECCPEG